MHILASTASTRTIEMTYVGGRPQAQAPVGLTQKLREHHSAARRKQVSPEVSAPRSDIRCSLSARAKTPRRCEMRENVTNYGSERIETSYTRRGEPELTAASRRAR